MTKINELKAILSENFDWNKARLDCFARMLLALFSVRTVNLSEMAVAFASKADVASRYKRLQRFFRYFRFDYAVVAKWIFKLFLINHPSKKIYLTIDRTNWFWGKSKINILTLGIAYEGVAIPLLWNLLDKAGNATAKEHEAVLQQFIDLFGKDCIAGVLADREFASGSLFDWLNKNKIPFYIRFKEDSVARIKNKKLRAVKKLFNHLKPKQKAVFGMSVDLFGQNVYLSASRSESGELMVIATNNHQHVHNAVSIYLRRWEIENLFSCLKTKGFCFEETQLTNLDRIKKLMALLAIGLCWAHRVGEWRAEKKPIRFSKHYENNRKSIRPQNSFFRYGFDFIREILLNPYKQIKEFRDCLNAIISYKNRLEGVL